MPQANIYISFVHFHWDPSHGYLGCIFAVVCVTTDNTYSNTCNALYMAKLLLNVMLTQR